MKPENNTAVIAAPKDEAWLQRHAEFVARAHSGDIDVLFLGDSLTDWWRDPKSGGPVWDRYFAGLSAANFGISADRTQHVLWRVRNGEADGYFPKVIVLLIGTNNTGTENDGRTPRNTPEETVQGIFAIIEELHLRFGETKILLLAIFPRNEKETSQRHQVLQINNALARLADNRRTFYLDIGEKFLNSEGSIRTDLMPDSLHLSTKGYEVFAKGIDGFLRNILKKQ